MQTFFGLATRLVFVALIAGALAPTDGRAGDAPRRGHYLAAIMDCAGCHTPGSLAGKPDATRHLGGSSIGFQIPDLGTFYPPNLTPDPETGLGSWTNEQIIAAVRTGVRPDGRILAPIMPYHSYAALTDEDAMELASYLKSLPPVRNKAPTPVGPTEKPIAPYLAPVVPK